MGLGLGGFILIMKYSRAKHIVLMKLLQLSLFSCEAGIGLWVTYCVKSELISNRTHIAFCKNKENQPPCLKYIL